MTMKNDRGCRQTINEKMHLSSETYTQILIDDHEVTRAKIL
jgi:hypothetical protein